MPWHKKLQWLCCCSRQLAAAVQLTKATWHRQDKVARTLNCMAVLVSQSTWRAAGLTFTCHKTGAEKSAGHVSYSRDTFWIL